MLKKSVNINTLPVPDVFLQNMTTPITAEHYSLVGSKSQKHFFFFRTECTMMSANRLSFFIQGNDNRWDFPYKVGKVRSHPVAGHTGPEGE
jgi:hypothetical protein